MLSVETVDEIDEVGFEFSVAAEVEIGVDFPSSGPFFIPPKGGGGKDGAALRGRLLAGTTPGAIGLPTSPLWD